MKEIIFIVQNRKKICNVITYIYLNAYFHNRKSNFNLANIIQNKDLAKLFHKIRKLGYPK